MSYALKAYTRFPVTRNQERGHVYMRDRDRKKLEKIKQYMELAFPDFVWKIA